MTSRWPALAIAFLAFIFAASGYGDYLSEEQRRKLDSNPLPRNVVPLSYTLRLYPDIASGTFNGSVKITVSCHESSNSITLHAHQYLTINEDTVSLRGSSHLPINGIIRNETDDTLTIKLEEALHKGSSYDLYLEFNGKLKSIDNDYYGQNEEDGGFFMSSYENTEKKTKSSFVFTKIFPNFARRIFPCFDDPRFKANFKISVARSTNMTTLSMNPVMYSVMQEDDLIWDNFLTIFPISTFSISILVSDLESHEPQNITSNSGDFQMQLYYHENRYMRNLEEDTEKFPAILQYLQDYLQVAYPLPQLKIVAIPNVYGLSSMYSPGLILSEEYLVSDREVQMKTAFASQWINSLITPPDWKSFNITYILTSFLQELATANVTSEVNSYQATVQSKYNDFASDFNRTDYDEYSIYSTSRGEMFLQMLRHAFGERVMRNALLHLIQENMFRTYTEYQFWRLLSQEGWIAQKLPSSLTVADIAHSWLHNKLYRFPVLTVTRNYQDNSAKLEQDVFTNDLTRNLTQEEKQHLWWIPVAYLSPENLDASYAKEVVWMGERELTISNLPNSASFIIVNPTDAGMFLVNYDEENWRLLTQSLMDPNSGIPIAARKKILNDAFLLAKAGELSYITALNVTLFLRNEKEYTVWTTLLNNIESIERLYKFSPIEEKMNDYLRKLLKPLMEDIAEPDGNSDNDYYTFWYNAKRIYNNVGNLKPIYEAQKLLNETMPIFIHSETKSSVVFCPAFMVNTSENWTARIEELQLYLQQIYEIRPYIERSFEKCPGYNELILRILNDLLDEDKVFTSEGWYRMTEFISNTGTAENLAFNYFLENYRDLKRKFYFMKDMWNNFLEAVTMNVRTEEGLNKLIELYELKEKLGYTKDTIEAAITVVTQAVEWKKKNLLDTELWFEQVLPNYYE